MGCVCEQKRGITGVLYHNIRKCGKILDMRKEDLGSDPSSDSYHDRNHGNVITLAVMIKPDLQGCHEFYLF